MKLIDQAAVIIGTDGPAVTEYCKDKGYIKAGQSWQNCEEKILTIIVKSKRGFVVAANSHIDKKNAN